MLDASYLTLTLFRLWQNMLKQECANQNGSVDGPVVREPKNIEVLIGTSLNDVFEYSGGYYPDRIKF